MCYKYTWKMQIEGRGADWHGHVTALSVAPNFRRLQLGGVLMNRLEQVTDNKKGFFVDLFVRKSNEVAVSMYTKLGYEIYRLLVFLIMLNIFFKNVNQ